MSVAYTEVYSSVELHNRLERWAEWARCPSPGSAGAAIGYMRERLDRSADSAVMTDEVAITERACARTKLKQKAYYRVIAKAYLGRYNTVEMAAFWGESEGSISRLLEDAKACVHGHILDIERNIDTDGFPKKTCNPRSAW